MGPRAALLDAAPFTRALRVERTQDGLFRVAPDPTSPVPALVSANRAGYLGPVSLPPLPADGICRHRESTVEIRLP
jgi:hypothetical protein